MDNYQLADSQSDFNDVISRGIDLLPDGITMIVTSRTPPSPPPRFTRLRVTGRICVVQGEDILFNLDESKELIRGFLLKTALLPWVTVEIAQRLTGNNRSLQILTDLHKSQFFTERDKGPDPIYRYYPLFREFLLSRGDAGPDPGRDPVQ